MYGGRCAARQHNAVRHPVIVDMHARGFELLPQRTDLLEVAVALGHGALQQQRVQLRLLL